MDRLADLVRIPRLNMLPSMMDLQARASGEEDPCSETEAVMAEMYACYSSVYSGCNYATDNGQCACNDPGLWPRYTNCLANTEHRICHSDIAIYNPKTAAFCIAASTRSRILTSQVTVFPTPASTTPSSPSSTRAYSSSPGIQSTSRQTVASISSTASRSRTASATSLSSSSKETKSSSASSNSSQATDSTTAETSQTVATSSGTSSIARWSGSGNLLTGVCSTPVITQFDGPTVTAAAFVGCIGGKLDCCPFTPITPSSVTVTTIGSTGVITIVTAKPTSGSGVYPHPEKSAKATLDRCPDDYSSISGGCCPRGFQVWTTQLGGETPCYTMYSLNAEAVMITPRQEAGAAAPTTTVMNMVYAIKYPLKPANQGLPTGLKIGIGVASAVAFILIFLIFLFVLRKQRSIQRRQRESLSQTLIEKRISYLHPQTDSRRTSGIPPPRPERPNYSPPRMDRYDDMARGQEYDSPPRFDGPPRFDDTQRTDSYELDHWKHNIMMSSGAGGDSQGSEQQEGRMRRPSEHDLRELELERIREMHADQVPHRPFKTDVSGIVITRSRGMIPASQRLISEEDNPYTAYRTAAPPRLPRIQELYDASPGTTPKGSPGSGRLAVENWSPGAGPSRKQSSASTASRYTIDTDWI